MTLEGGWKNPRWEYVTDPVMRQVLDSLEAWTRNPIVASLRQLQPGAPASYNPIIDGLNDPGYSEMNGDSIVSGHLSSASYVAGSSGWRIKADGTAEFNNVTVRGSIAGGTIDIGGSDSSSFHVDSGGNVWSGGGTFASANFRVSASGSLDIGAGDAATTSFHVANTGSTWWGAAAYADAPARVSNTGSLFAGGIISGGALAGNHHFSVSDNTGNVYIDGGSAYVRNASGQSGINFQFSPSAGVFSHKGAIFSTTTTLEIENSNATAGISLTTGSSPIVIGAASSATLQFSMGEVEEFTFRHVLEGFDTTHNFSGVAMGYLYGSKSADLSGKRHAWVQTGSTVATTSLGGDITVTFGTAFPGTPNFTCSNGDNNLAHVPSGSAVSSSAATVRVRDFAGAALASQATSVNWIAVWNN